MILNYKQSCTKISLDWDNENLNNICQQCPFCRTFYVLYIVGTTVYFVECNKCKYSIAGYSFKNGISAIYYNGRSLHKLKYQQFICSKSRCAKEWEQLEPFNDLQTILNKMNSLIFPQ